MLLNVRRELAFINNVCANFTKGYAADNGYLAAEGRVYYCTPSLLMQLVWAKSSTLPVRFLWLQEMVRACELQIEKIWSEENPANVDTKWLNPRS